MNSVRYFVALFLVISLPPLFLYWLLVHPFVNFWRGQGIGVTYGCLLAVITAGMVGLFSIRHFLLSIEYGTSYPLVAFGLVLLGLSGTMRLMIRNKLTIKVLLGLPEVAPDRFPRELMTDGLYARMRHPRYVQFLLALAGYALIANYLAVSHGRALGAGGLHHRAARGKRITRSLWRRLHRVLPSGSALYAQVKSASRIE
jgi:protein-S-isoprenylcysteine O-methyltransferase Ste14